MHRTIRQIQFPASAAQRLTRVAAYARVSSGKDAMLHSLSAQVSYYSELIQNHPGWLYCGVYADEAVTGTKDKRDDFQRMLADCRQGKMDLIITKSISRFARNTVTLLQTVRELKALGVDVFFEEQNIHTQSADGELMMTILASYAQEESRSASENQKWRIRRNFESGMPWNGTMLGYRYDKGTLVVVSEEAETVKRIFEEYLSGLGLTAIAKRLNADGIPTRFGNAWGKSSVLAVLRNYAYTGNLLLQTSRRTDHLTKRDVPNCGELPQYHVLDCHDAIISQEQFHAAQTEILRRAEKHTHPGVKARTYPFTGLITCGCCGKHYRRKVTAACPVWICSTFNTLGKNACPSKQIPEETLHAATAAVLGRVDFPEELLRRLIKSILVCKGNMLIFRFYDGTEVTRKWQDRSRADSWTPEMKEAARHREIERRQNQNAI